MSGLTAFQAIIGVISLIFIILNYKKIHEYHLNVQIRAQESLWEIPTGTTIEFKNPTNNSINGLSVETNLIIGERTIIRSDPSNFNLEANEGRTLRIRDLKEELIRLKLISESTPREEVQNFMSNNTIILYIKYSYKHWVYREKIIWQIFDNEVKWRFPRPEEQIKCDNLKEKFRL